MDTRTISDDLRDRVLKRDNYTCRHCGDKHGPFHMYHVYPYVKGGETTIYNLVTACSHCNHSKNDSVGMWPKPIGYFEKRPRHAIYILIAAFFGITLLVYGSVASNKGFAIEGRTMFMIGIFLSVMSIGYLMSRKLE